MAKERTRRPHRRDRVRTRRVAKARALERTHPTLLDVRHTRFRKLRERRLNERGVGPHGLVGIVVGGPHAVGKLGPRVELIGADARPNAVLLRAAPRGGPRVARGGLGGPAARAKRRRPRDTGRSGSSRRLLRQRRHASGHLDRRTQQGAA